MLSSQDAHVSRHIPPDRLPSGEYLTSHRPLTMWLAAIFSPVCVFTAFQTLRDGRTEVERLYRVQEAGQYRQELKLAI